MSNNNKCHKKLENDNFVVFVVRSKEEQLNIEFLKQTWKEFLKGNRKLFKKVFLIVKVLTKN